MRSGSLNHTLTIERAETTLDEYRIPVETWSTLAIVKAEVKSIGMDEDTKSVSEVVGVFQIRYFADLQLTDRIGFRGVRFNIFSIVEGRRRSGLEIRAKARAA